jgi:hypothetical protein
MDDDEDGDGDLVRHHEPPRASFLYPLEGYAGDIQACPRRA